METEKNTTPLAGRTALLLSQDNLDAATVDGFGKEWDSFDQRLLNPNEKAGIFEEYFSLFPWGDLPVGARGADIGCGSGRWASFVAPRVGHLLLVDPSSLALENARGHLKGTPNADFVLAHAENIPVMNESFDFAYSLGVLHHVPDTERALHSIALKLKPGAPFLLYLYYAFDHSPLAFRALWRIADSIRRGVARLPFPLKRIICDAFAIGVYWPIARSALVVEWITGRAWDHWPLSYYRAKSFFVMRTDALDRFGTRLENRFSQLQIRAMLERAGFDGIQFSPRRPFWTVLCRKRAN